MLEELEELETLFVWWYFVYVFLFKDLKDLQVVFLCV